MDVALNRLIRTLGGKPVFGRDVTSLNELIQEIRQGLPPAVIDALMDTYGLTAKDLAKPLGVSLSTIKRRHQKERLNPVVSDHLYRVANVLTLATDILGDRHKVLRWLNKPNRALNGNTPMSRLDTHIGYEQVEDILFRIEHGIAA